MRKPFLFFSLVLTLLLSITTFTQVSPAAEREVPDALSYVIGTPDLQLVTVAMVVAVDQTFAVFDQNTAMVMQTSPAQRTDRIPLINRSSTPNCRDVVRSYFKLPYTIYQTHTYGMRRLN